MEEVENELKERGINEKGIATLEPVLILQGSSAEKISAIKQVLASSATGMEGVAELEKLFDLISHAGINQQVEVDLSLARGLNYYTGAIFEVKAKDFGNWQHLRRWKI